MPSLGAKKSVLLTFANAIDAALAAPGLISRTSRAGGFTAEVRIGAAIRMSTSKQEADALSRCGERAYQERASAITAVPPPSPAAWPTAPASPAPRKDGPGAPGQSRRTPGRP